MNRKYIIIYNIEIAETITYSNISDQIKSKEKFFIHCISTPELTRTHTLFSKQIIATEKKRNIWWCDAKIFAGKLKPQIVIEWNQLFSSRISKKKKTNNNYIRINEIDLQSFQMKREEKVKFDLYRTWIVKIILKIRYFDGKFMIAALHSL